MAKEKQSEEKPSGITRRDFLKGIAVGAVVTGAVATGVAAATWPAAPPAPPGAVTKTETVTTTAPAVTRTTTAAATTVTTTAPPVTTTATTTVTAPPPPLKEAYERTITLNVNGKDYTLDVQNRDSLLYVLRDRLGFTGPKRGCRGGECGMCTVLMDGKQVLSCLIPAANAGGKKITTIEGLAPGEKLHPIQEAFWDKFGWQCGYCTPGMIMATKELLDTIPNPTDEEIRYNLSGVLCRCGNYIKILESVKHAAKLMGGK